MVDTPQNWLQYKLLYVTPTSYKCVYIRTCIYIYPPYFQSLAWKQSYLPFGDCFLQASVPSSGQHTTVGESLAHTKLPHLYTQPWGWGGAREEKCRIYQPHPLLNITIGTQPLLDFLRLTITLQPRGVGWG